MNQRDAAAGPTGAVVLELDGVSKSFGAVTAVDGLTERLGRGEYFCILGPSGCGKTTLLRLVAGFEAPDAGTIRLHGADVTAVPPERRDVNIVFQQYALFPHLTVAGNVGFGLRMRRVPRRDVQTRVTEALRLVRLDAEADRLPRQLSGGQQQRVALARALVVRPAVLLLDEPLSALDHALRLEMQEELRRIQRTTGVTFLHITHDQQEALALADRIAVMRAGRFVQVGPPADIYRRPASAFVAQFVGAANLVPCDVASDGHARLRDSSSLGTVPAGPGPALLAIRAESLRVQPPDIAREDAPRGTVTHLAFVGAAVDCTVELRAGVVLRARLTPDAAARLRENDACAVDPVADEIVILPAGAAEALS